MKTLSSILLAVLFVSTAFSVAPAAELPFEEGSVWSVMFIRSEPGMRNTYIRWLRDVWEPNQREAIKNGLTLSYKALWSRRATEDDWDILLLVELKNMAALDGREAKWRELQDARGRTLDTIEKESIKRSEIRTYIGGKYTRELILKGSSR